MVGHRANRFNFIEILVARHTNISIFGLLMIALFFMSACGNSASSPPRSAESALPNTNLLNEEFQMQDFPALDNIRFEHISSDDGLSQNAIFAILQDSHGFMWFGTEDGLNKYDGRNFTVYKHDSDNANSLSDDRIWAIHEDQQGNIWIGTLNGGLNRYDRNLDQFIHYRHDPDSLQSLINDEVLAVYEDSEGILWIGTREGLDRFDKDTEIFIHYRYNPNNPSSLSANAVLSIYETSDGALWIGTDGGGLNRFDNETESFTHFSSHPNDPSSLSHNTVRAIYEDSFGTIWIGTDAGLNRMDREAETFTHFQNNPDDIQSLSHNSVQAIYEDPSGALWVGTNGGGLSRFDDETQTFTHYQNNPSDLFSLSHYSVYNIYQDREGVLWIGTWGGGLNKLFLGELNFAYFNHDPNDSNSLSSSDVRGIHEDQSGSLWVATDGGLNRFNRETGQWQHYLHDPDDPFSISSNIVGDIYEDQEGLLWIGTYNDKGINSFNPETERFTRYQNDPDDPLSFQGGLVSDIYQDREGILWIGTFDRGLNRYDPETETFSHYQSDSDDPDSIISDGVVSIYEDQQGQLWLGTLNGLDRLDRENNVFTHFQTDSQDSSSLSNNFVIIINEDSEGTLWIGTSEGLNKFNPETTTFTQYREQDGLPSDFIYAILEDEKGYLWLSTNHGISRFDSQTETFRNFDLADGLQSNEFSGFSYYKSSSGEMFFGGINGFNSFYPDRVQADNLYRPQIALTQFSQGGQILDLAQTFDNASEIRLNWPNQFFEFEFSALSYVHPEENQYAYMLEGFDDDWNYVGTRAYGRYTNLPGGSYTLRIIGSNNDGIWNEDGASLMITIVPPIWETWWFRGIAIIAVVGSIIGSYGLRVRNVEVHSHELEQLVKGRTSELSNANALLEREIADREQVEAKLAQRAVNDAIVEERRRMARDLHDSVTQSVYSVTLFAEAARHIAKEIGNEVIERQIGQIGQVSQQVLKEMRLLVYELRPPELEKVGLTRSLRQRLQAVEGRAGLEARIISDNLIKLPEDVEKELYFIAQEALNNALKHASATSIIVHLREDKGQAELEIIDDGVGFELDTIGDRSGMGLRGIRERAEKLGGTATIQSVLGEGTSIKITLTIEENIDE